MFSLEVAQYKENVTIKSNTIIGMGSVVLKNINGGIFFNKLK